MLVSRKYIFVVFVCYLVPVCTSVGLSACEKIGLCQCLFSNGVTINLTPLSRSRESSLVAALADVTVYFHPCSDVPLGNSSKSSCAKASSLCLYNKTSNTYYNLGKSADAVFSSEGLHTTVLKYSNLGKSAAIQLVCESVPGAGSTLVIEAVNTSYAALVLKSPWACARRVMDADAADTTMEGMSTGSLLVILFFVFSLVYAGGGALALRFLRGASGREMIPNYDFWADLPYLCRDGLLFMISGCKPLPAYDRI
ncbi:uncharacterized protein LOC134542466 [Bacillus rossius redtenbacheri]|uniref:uncharacterized protein LOC134542466 n=1 Tax=Bacillus rossius redtenbacheri TaxID=93214 RepID=UPI002FDD5AFB